MKATTKTTKKPQAPKTVAKKPIAKKAHVKGAKITNAELVNIACKELRQMVEAQGESLQWCVIFERETDTRHIGVGDRRFHDSVAGNLIRGT